MVPGGVGGRGTGPRDGANFATCVVFLTFLTRIKRRKMIFLKDTLWGGRGARAREGGSRGFGSGGVGGRGTGPRDGANFAICVVRSDCEDGLLRGDMSREATRCNNYQR